MPTRKPVSKSQVSGRQGFLVSRSSSFSRVHSLPKTASPKKPLVLLVEDDRDTREMYQMFLEHEGFAVMTVKDGAAALVAAKATPPNVLVTDLTLPRLNGLELCKQLRADDSTRHIPLVLLTGHALVEDDGTFDRMLLKPCLPNTLADVIRELAASTN